LHDLPPIHVIIGENGMDYRVIIPAAGCGKRMGYGKNKLFIPILNIPVLIRTLQCFEQDAWCAGIVLVISERDRDEVGRMLDKFRIRKVADVVMGGVERQESVRNGLNGLEGEGVVLIHDGARPFIRQHAIHRVVETAAEKGAAVLGVPAKDTVKKVEKGKVVATEDRRYLWQIQTPQAFRLPIIREAHRRAERDGFLGTDDASLVERIGEKVFVVPGDYMNIKITTREDLVFAEAILRMENAGGGFTPTGKDGESVSDWTGV
jgi:2-C-methyl-D-erythritol 4-phosphate cytidylyltransferase (EC 2.7.7.60)